MPQPAITGLSAHRIGFCVVNSTHTLAQNAEERRLEETFDFICEETESSELSPQDVTSFLLKYVDREVLERILRFDPHESAV